MRLNKSLATLTSIPGVCYSACLKSQVKVKKYQDYFISRKKTPFQTNYSINGHIIEQVTNMKDLGVLVSKDLSWSKHIKGIVSQANKILGLIKRICKDVKNVQTRRTLYCALVRSKLEYASNVWSPYTIKHKLLIENVQRRATRFILNYPKDMCYKERLQK